MLKVSYTLSDGTVVDAAGSGAPTGSLGAMSSDKMNFVGVVDSSDKGISSVVIRLAATAAGAQQAVEIDDLAFAMAGPPPSG